MKILLVDDDQNFRNMAIDIILRKINAEIIEAENGSEGIVIARREKFDLIILDNDMPVMNGHEFLGRIRSDTKIKDTPVIVMTASNDSATISRYLNLDVSEYILKPFKQVDLISKIKKTIKVRKKIFSF